MATSDEKKVSEDLESLRSEKDKSIGLIHATVDKERAKELFTRIYEAAHSGDKSDASLQAFLQDIAPQELSFLEANAELVDRVMGVENPNDLNEILAAMDPELNIEVPSFQEGAITNEQLSYLKKQWAWVVISADKKAKVKNKELKQTLSRSGLPILFKPATKKEPASLSFAILGGSGYDEGLLADKEVRAEILEENIPPLGGENFSAEDIMRTCYAMIEMAKDYGFGAIQIDGGHDDLKRNIWAIASVNGLDVLGFSPSPENLQWLNSRERHLKETFNLGNEKQAEKRLAPGIGGKVSKGENKDVDSES